MPGDSAQEAALNVLLIVTSIVMQIGSRTGTKANRNNGTVLGMIPANVTSFLRDQPSRINVHLEPTFLRLCGAWAKLACRVTTTRLEWANAFFCEVPTYMTTNRPSRQGTAV
jgi:hypothetical protein